MSEMKEILYRLTEMGQDIKGIKTDVAELKTRMGNVESSLGQIQTRQEVIFEQTAGLLEFRTETKAILLDIQDSQMATSHILGEHEISIRNLRRRLV
jgi:hypothetical protein